MRPPDYDSGDGRAKLWCGDCLEILPELDSVDFVVTDPPWIASKKGVVRVSSNVAPIIQLQLGVSYGDIGEFSSEALQVAFEKTRHDMLVICGYKELGKVIQVLDPIRGVFIWHKPNGGLSVSYPCPLDVAYIVWGAHTSRMTGYQHWRSGVMSHSFPNAGCISNGERILEEKNGKAAHPAQGPVSLYRQLVEPLSGTLLDPYMGSGTCGVACVEAGISFRGIEIEPKFFDMAVRRIKRALQEDRSSLFPVVKEIEHQPEMFV